LRLFCFGIDWISINSAALADDVGASPFYITNAYVKLIGNAASGGWSGFSFPNLPGAVGLHQYAAPYFCPMNRPLLLFQGTLLSEGCSNLFLYLVSFFLRSFGFCSILSPLFSSPSGNSAHSTGFWQEHAAGVYLGGNLHHDANGNYVYTTGRDISRYGWERMEFGLILLISSLFVLVSRKFYSFLFPSSNFLIL
jgi:hypothetical protein